MRKHRRSAVITSLSLIFVMPHLVDTLKSVGLNAWLAILVTTLVLFPFALIPSLRIWRAMAQEKQAMERRFAEEDARMFGRPLS